MYAGSSGLYHDCLPVGMGRLFDAEAKSAQKENPISTGIAYYITNSAQGQQKFYNSPTFFSQGSIV
jgi:hypothetical protein